MRYKLKPFPDREAIDRLAGEASVNPVTAALLLQRGVKTGAEAREFFRPRTGGDPLLLPDIDKAAAILDEALSRGWGVMIFGDYDVDGQTATAILSKALSGLGFRVGFRLPDRLNSGYDVTPAQVREIAAEGWQVLLTCDCGSRASEAVKTAKELGMKVIVTDHHELGADAAAPHALINPHRPDSRYPYEFLCGAGVAYRFIHGLLLRRGIDPRGFLRKYADLVCLGTVADSVPLTGENRYLVKEGLEYVKQPVSRRIGIKTLIERGKPEEVTAKYLSFFVIPQLNSASRMGETEKAFRLLTETDPARLEEQLADLSELNNRRKKEEEEGYGKAALDVYKGGMDKDDVIVVKGSWLHSLSGNIASRLCKTFNRPVIAIGESRENGVCIGSARNNDMVDILSLLEDCAGLLERYGGHKAAGGITIREDNIPAFRSRINEACRRRYPEGPSEAAEAVDLQIGSSCFAPGRIMPLCEELERMEPFGEANRRPVFLTKNVLVEGAEVFGKTKKHLRLRLGEKPCSIEAILWNRGEELYSFSKGMRINVIYSPELHSFREKTARLIVTDWAPGS
ncbi:MAG: single-stranded-DNA-specific exonuclease RecJ [Abditibacteriota bacterium]|nr:single-stranded-DNA-specific exonuclease RecJ [Abditibacteriota bacterium]